MPGFMPYDEWEKKRAAKQTRSTKKRTAAEKAKYNLEYNKENTVLVSVRLQKSSGIPAAMEKMTAATGIPATKYLRTILIERLKADGYLQEE